MRLGDLFRAAIASLSLILKQHGIGACVRGDIVVNLGAQAALWGLDSAEDEQVL